MHQLHNVLFATSLGDCEAAFPKRADDVSCLDWLRSLLARFTVIGKKAELQGCGLVDVGRTGILTGLAEHMDT